METENLYLHMRRAYKNCNLSAQYVLVSPLVSSCKRAPGANKATSAAQYTTARLPVDVPKCPNWQYNVTCNYVSSELFLGCHMGKVIS